MSVAGKIISIINVIYLVFLISFPFWGGGVNSFLFVSILGIAVVVLPIILGVFSSIAYYQKFRKSRVVQKKMDRVLAAVPIINFFLIFIVIMLIR